MPALQRQEWPADDPLHDMRQEVRRQRHEDGADDLRREWLADMRDEARYDAREDDEQ